MEATDKQLDKIRNLKKKLCGDKNDRTTTTQRNQHLTRESPLDGDVERQRKLIHKNIKRNNGDRILQVGRKESESMKSLEEKTLRRMKQKRSYSNFL